MVHLAMSCAYAPTGWYATFDPEISAGQVVEMPVEAWSGDGHALVVRPDQGRLVKAKDERGFKQLLPCQRVTVLRAGDGWEMNFPAEPDKGQLEPWSAPVVGWLVADSGEASPLVASSDNGVFCVSWRRGTLTWPA